MVSFVSQMPTTGSPSFFTGPATDEEESDAIQEDLLAVFKVSIHLDEELWVISYPLQSTVPLNSDAPLVVDLSDAEPICMYFAHACNPFHH
jgi:hypothetical protein